VRALRENWMFAVQRHARMAPRLRVGNAARQAPQYRSSELAISPSLFASRVTTALRPTLRVGARRHWVARAHLVPPRKQHYASAGVRIACTIAGPFTAILLNRPAVYGGLNGALWSFPSPVHRASRCNGLSHDIEKPHMNGAGNSCCGNSVTRRKRRA
jgi:hypothetical protein